MFINSCYHNNWNIQHTVKTTPLLKDLYELISPNFGAEWKVIGTCLSLPIGELNIIEANYPNNARCCCNEMLEKWLEMDPNASWEKLFTAIESPAVSNQEGMVHVMVTI